MVGSGKYRICSFGDWVVHYALALDAQRSGVTLPETFKSNFVNVLDLHYDQNPSGPHVATIEELLKANDLEASPTAATDLRAKTDGASLVRILNRMIRTHKTRFDGQNMAANNESTEESKTEVKRDRSRSRSQEKSTDGKFFQISFKLSFCCWSKIFGQFPFLIAICKIDNQKKEADLKFVRSKKSKLFLIDLIYNKLIGITD